MKFNTITLVKKKGIYNEQKTKPGTDMTHTLQQQTMDNQH